MLASSPAVDLMLQGSVVTAQARIGITLPGGIYPDLTLACTDLQIAASLASDIPAQSRMQAGYLSTTASFTLQGLLDVADATRTAAWLFRRYNAASPLYRQDALMCPVTVDVDLFAPGAAGVPETIRKFTGFIDSYTEAADGAVAFECIGGSRAFLRSLPDMAGVIATPGTVITADVAIAAILDAAGGSFPRVLDTSLNSLHVIPPVTAGTDPAQLIQQICEAELAVATFDEAGIFRFRNRATLRGTGVARPVTSATSLTAVGVETLAAAVINRAQVAYTAWTFADPGTVWSLEEPWLVPLLSTVTRTVTTDGMVFGLDLTIEDLPAAGPVLGHSYVRWSTTKGGLVRHPGVTTTAVVTGADQVTLTFTNSTGIDAWTVASADDTAPAAGTPVLILGGTPVAPSTEVTVDYQHPAVVDGGAASSRFGEVLWSLSTPWVQDPDAALLLARDVVLDACVPRPNLTGITITPDPRLQLADVVYVQDPDVTMVNEYARIYAWSLSIAADAWSMTLDARTLAPPGGWVLGVAGRSELASTTYLQGA